MPSQLTQGTQSRLIEPALLGKLALCLSLLIAKDMAPCGLAQEGKLREAERAGAGLCPAKGEASGTTYNRISSDKPQATGKPTPGTQGRELIKGRVVASPSPFLTGSIVSIPKGTKLDLILTGNLNSEVSQKGDEILAKVAFDVKDDERVLLPNGWYVHGTVTDVQSQKRLGRDGFVEVEFDTLISPDGNYELDFPARLSTRDHQLKAVTKTLVTDAGYVTAGAAAGALLSVQLTGIPLAVATHGYSVAIGAGVGAGLGALGALKRKGKIASFYPGDELKLTLSEPITLPGFDPAYLPAKVLSRTLAGLSLSIERCRFGKDPYGDSHARLLTVDLTIDNETDKEFRLFDLAVISDHNQRYYPSLLTDFPTLKRKVRAKASERASISFSVDSQKHRYWLVMLDRANRQELVRVPIN